MIFVAKNADFSAKNIGSVNIDFNVTEPDNTGGTSDSSTVKVTMISIDESVTTVKVGNTNTFTAEVFPTNATDKTIIWSCSPTTCASIDSSTGELTAIKEGTVTVKAKATDGSNVLETLTINIEAKTKEDVSDLTKTVLGYYGNHHTDAQAVALDNMINTLGGNNTDSIWSKIKVIQLPCLANDINKAFVNAKTGVDHMTYTSSGKKNAEANSIEWNCYGLENGNVKCLDTSNTKNTLNVPIYQSQLKLSECSFIFGGQAEFAGGTGCVIPITTSTKLYTNGNLNRRIGADYVAPCIKGFSVSYDNGYDATAIVPSNKVSVTYGSADALNTIKAGYNTDGTEYHWNTYMRCFDQYYCLVLGQYLTKTELETACQAFDTLVKAFNVSQEV